jgi:hypothetical protein
MNFSFEYEGHGRWRVSVLCFSGKIAHAEGSIVQLSRLVRRAERLFELWARPRAEKPTLRAVQHSGPASRPIVPATPSATNLEPRGVKSTMSSNPPARNDRTG